jgi:NAD(P)-dependent dehydrogenase (short-subunit alcohol dehydrogenase family)
MTGRLADKVAIVTGTGGGLGREIAITFHRQGGTVVCSDIQETPADTNEPNIQYVIDQEGGRSLFIKADITNSTEVEALVKETVKKFGKLEMYVESLNIPLVRSLSANMYTNMINNAGILAERAKAAPIWDFDEDVFNLAIKVDLKGTMLGTKYASRQMIKQEPHRNGQRGWIVNLSSIYGLVGEATIGTSHHCAVCCANG